jgi:hypothetical protein
MMSRVVAGLLPAVVPRLYLTGVYETSPVYALLVVTAGTRQAPALSRAAFGVKENNWLRGSEDTVFDTQVVRVATRLLELAPRAVPEIVLYPCLGGRATDIARVIVATQPGTVRHLALCNFESETDQAEALEILKLACTTWGASSLRDLVIGLRRTGAEFPCELFSAAARCRRLEVLQIPGIVLPLSFVASMVEGPSGASSRRGATGADAATPARINSPFLPSPTTRRFDFAPYTATLRSLELSLGPDDAEEFAFIATQLPSLRCLILAARGGGARDIPAAVWRCGLRQLLRQLHKLYIASLSRPLCRALNTLHDLTAADGRRSAARHLPNAMTAILLSDSDKIDDDSDDSDADLPFSSTPIDAGSPINADVNPTEDIPLQLFSIFAHSSGRPYSTAPFMRYLGRYAPCLTDVGLSRSTADTVAELITMRGPCRAVDLRDVHGLTDTIVASILKRHRATLRQVVVDNIVDNPVEYDPRAYISVLGGRDTPQGAPFTKLAPVAFEDFEWSDEQRAYFSYLLPGLCDPRAEAQYLMPP